MITCLFPDVRNPKFNFYSLILLLGMFNKTYHFIKHNLYNKQLTIVNIIKMTDSNFMQFAHVRPYLKYICRVRNPQNSQIVDMVTVVFKNAVS